MTLSHMTCLDDVLPSVDMLPDWMNTAVHMALQCHVDVSLSQLPDRSWRRHLGRPRIKWPDQLLDTLPHAAYNTPGDL